MRARVGKEEAQTAARHRALSQQHPLRPSLFFPIAPVAESSWRKGAGQRPSAPLPSAMIISSSLASASHRSSSASGTPRLADSHPSPVVSSALTLSLPFSSVCRRADARLCLRGQRLALPSFGALRSRPRCRVRVCACCEGKPGSYSWIHGAVSPLTKTSPADATIDHRPRHPRPLPARCGACVCL